MTYAVCNEGLAVLARPMWMGFEGSRPSNCAVSVLQQSVTEVNFPPTRASGIKMTNGPILWHMDHFDNLLQSAFGEAGLGD